jgi:hypothetical protein
MVGTDHAARRRIPDRGTVRHPRSHHCTGRYARTHHTNSVPSLARQLENVVDDPVAAAPVAHILMTLAQSAGHGDAASLSGMPVRAASQLVTPGKPPARRAFLHAPLGDGGPMSYVPGLR